MRLPRQTTLIHRINNNPIQQRPQSNHIPHISAPIRRRPIGKRIPLPNRNRNILTQSRHRTGSSPPLQNNLLRGVIADLEEAVRVVGSALEDPGRETAFEAPVLDDVDRWGGGAACGAGGGSGR